MKFKFVYLFLLILANQLQATIVVPFNNLGHLSEASEEVVIVKVLEKTNDNLSFYGWNVQITKSFKGSLSINSIINIESMSIATTENLSAVSGDINLVIGQEYLIFLDQSENGAWRPMTLSYYLYENKELEGVDYFVPVEESLEIHIEGESNGVFVIEKNKFITYLDRQQKNKYKYAWDDQRFIANKTIDDFYPKFRAAPAHCTFLMTGGGTGFRWDIFPSASLEVYCDTEADSGYSGSHGSVGDAIIDMSTSYAGINIVNEGVVSTNYTPNCSGGSAAGGNFTSYCNGLNGGDNNLIIFNDPCSQIPNLSGCSGTLAIGGSYGSGPIYTYDGSSWYTSTNAYVIVNNGTGACQSPSEYKSMLTHEMTHGLGLSHIASGNGSANMNPSCCNNIQTLDIDCVDYLYPPTGGVDLEFDSTVDQITCNGICDGLISITNVTNGTSPYDYIWSSGQTTATITDLCTGTYTVTVSDAASNTGTESFTITEPSQLNITTSVTHTSCGDNNGSISAFPNGGTPSYDYEWSTGSTNSTITNLTSGSYNLTVTDSNDCSEFEIGIIINGSNTMILNTSSTDETANDANDGTATVSQTGGTNPINYSWSNGATTASTAGLSPGTYTVIVSDGMGCSVTDMVTIDAFICPSLTIIDAQQNASCNLLCDGSIVISSITNGNAPYEYEWSNGASTVSILNLCAGNYNVTVTDNSNCSITKSYTISEPLAIIPNATSTNESANNTNDGSATCSPTNGVAPLSFSWSNGEATQSISGLTPGSYTVTVSDTNDCTAEETIIVTEFICPTLTIFETEQNLNCYGECDGSISITTITNGVSPYEYVWSNGETTATISNLCVDTYSVTVTDSKNCQIEASYEITQPIEFTTTVTITNTSCGLENGIIVLAPTGGVMPYIVEWDNGSNGNGIDGLASGSYAYTITDDNNCTIIGSADVTSSTAVLVSANATDETTYNANDGIVTSTPTGGIIPYTYLWNNGDTTQSITDLTPGIYTVTVTDTLGCTGIAMDTVNAFVCPTITIVENITTSICPSECQSSITITNNENAPYNYIWSTGDTTQTIMGLCSGTYFLTLTDASNCSALDTFVVTEPTEIATNLVSTNESYNDANDGMASTSVSGGTSPYTYLWSNGETADTITNLTPGEYFLTVTDNNNCEKLDTATILAYNCNPLVIADTIVDLVCYNICDGSISLSITNGLEPYIYTWDNGDTTSTTSNLCSGTYYITVIDANNCSIIDSFDVLQATEIILTSSSTDETANGNNDGTATSTATGGTPNYTYQWSNGDSLQSINNLTPGIYTITVTDTIGCFAFDTISVAAFGCTGQDIFFNQTNISCNGACDGVIEITSIDSSAAPYEYLWSNGDSTNTVTGLCPGNYTVMVLDSNNCSIVSNFLISEPLALTTTTSSADESSYQGENGSANTTPIGGSQPYTFLWSNGDTTQSTIELAPGQYIVMVSDSNSCTVNDTISINPFVCDTINYTSTIKNASCYGACDGEISITTTPINNSLNYVWNNGDTTSTITDLCSGTYTLIITDTSNCSYLDTFTITQPNEIIIIVDTIIHLMTNSTASISVSTNSATHTYKWAGPSSYTSSDMNIQNLTEAGCYKLVVTDTTTNCTQDTILCVDDLTSISQTNNQTDINIFPNPTNGLFTIDFNQSKIGEANIKLYDINGKTRHLIMKSISESTINLDIDHLEKGMYLIQIETLEGSIYYEKIILTDKK